MATCGLSDSAEQPDQYPKFKLNQSRFNQATFWGRFCHFLDIIDPRTLFTTEYNERSTYWKLKYVSALLNAALLCSYYVIKEHGTIIETQRADEMIRASFKTQLNNAVQLLEDFKNNKLDAKTSSKDLWEAQKIKQAIIHPDTNEKIFMPFRMSGYVPFGTPIVTGLLLPNPTIIQMVFWQWLNQSHNACVNYANRNATKPTSTQTFVQGYLGATSAAVSIAVALTLLVRRAKSFQPATRLFIERFVPFPAVAAASVTNVILMRRHELHQGIDVSDRTGNVIGTSRNAAKKALQEVALTRAILPAPIFLIPPLILTQLEKTRWLKSNPRWHLPLNALLVTLSFGLALPIAISIFPQWSQISCDQLEDDICEATAEPVLFYNKGL